MNMTYYVSSPVTSGPEACRKRHCMMIRMSRGQCGDAFNVKASVTVSLTVWPACIATRKGTRIMTNPYDDVRKPYTGPCRTCDTETHLLFMDGWGCSDHRGEGRPFCGACDHGGWKGSLIGDAEVSRTLCGADHCCTFSDPKCSCPDPPLHWLVYPE